MKPLLIFSLLIFSNTTSAQVFKCESASKKITYQDNECVKASTQTELFVEKIDPKIIFEAQKRLNRDLQLRKISEDIQAHNEEKIKEQLDREALIRASREHAYALERNTQAQLTKNRQRQYYNQTNHQPNYVRPEPSLQVENPTITRPHLTPQHTTKFNPNKIVRKHSKYAPLKSN